MIEMVEDFRLPNGKLARVARRNDRFFVVLGPRTDATVLGPHDNQIDTLRCICRMLNPGVLS